MSYNGKNFIKILEDARWKYYQNEREVGKISLLYFFNLDEEEFQKYLNQLLTGEKKGDYKSMLAEYIRLYIRGKEDQYSEILKKNVNTFLEKVPDLDLSKVTLRPKPVYMKDAKLNSGFRDRIVNSVPQNFNNFEKAFYLFVKLCHTLSHDEADLSSKVEFTINHTDINRLQEVDENNNIIVCYEWVVILALFYEVFNISYEITGDEVFGRNHLGINVLYDNLLINFEATLGITCSDLTRVKNNIQAAGISLVQSCSNDECYKIIESIDKVYKYFEEKENQKYYPEPELINQERKKIVNLSSRQRIQMFMEKVILSPHKNIVDNMKYMQLWKQILFSKDNTLLLSNIIYNSEQKNGNKYEVGILLSCQIDDDIEYFIYTSQYGFKEITKEQFEISLDNSTIEFINENDKLKISSQNTDTLGQNKRL